LYTRLSSVAVGSEGNWSTYSVFLGKVAHFESESVAYFTTECLVRFAPEQVAHLAAESVVGCHRNPHSMSIHPPFPISCNKARRNLAVHDDWERHLESLHKLSYIETLATPVTHTIQIHLIP